MRVLSSPRSVDNDDNSTGEYAQGDEPFLSIIETVIDECYTRSGQHLLGVAKIQAMLSEVARFFASSHSYCILHPACNYFCNYMQVQNHGLSGVRVLNQSAME